MRPHPDADQAGRAQPPMPLTRPSAVGQLWLKDAELLVLPVA